MAKVIIGSTFTLESGKTLDGDLVVVGGATTVKPALLSAAVPLLPTANWLSTARSNSGHYRQRCAG